MRVLRKAISAYVKEIECDNCRSLLEYDEFDVCANYGEWNRTDYESSERAVENYIKCPVCRNCIIVGTYKEFF